MERGAGFNENLRLLQNPYGVLAREKSGVRIIEHDARERVPILNTGF
jgi:hypothetical protein